MAKKATGEIIKPNGKRKSYSLRVPLGNGERVVIPLGKAVEYGGTWAPERADEALADAMAKARLGMDPRPEPEPEPGAPKAEPTFAEFRSEWIERKRPGLAPKSEVDYEWALDQHLGPWFDGFALSRIDAKEIDRYAAAKLTEGRIAANSLNKTLSRLSQVMEDACEYGLIDKNPVTRRRRVKGEEPRRTWVEPEQFMALLDAANQLTLRPVLATMAGAGGLRVGAAVALDWPDIDLAGRTISVGRDKTDAGNWREVDMTIGLVEVLTELRAERDGDGAVFLNRRGRRQTARNVAAQLKKAIKAANQRLAKLAIKPISERVTPHSLRRTYPMLRAYCGDHPDYTARQMGHRDARFTYRVYQSVDLRRRERLPKAHRERFDRALEWASMAEPATSIGTGIGTEALSADAAKVSRIEETASPSHVRL